MRVFVLLPAHLDVEQWRREYAKGLTPDETPYGYHHAADYGCEVEFSRATPTGRPPLSWLRKLSNRLFDADLVHVLNNLHQIRSGSYDVVWTHTEREHIGLTLLRRLFPWLAIPPMISQSVWLMDRWPKLSPIRRAYLRWVLGGADILTFLSPVNAEAARTEGLNKHVAVVEFGISADSFALAPPDQTAAHSPIRVFAPGNDVHRDWQTFAEGLGDDDRFEVSVGSRFFPKQLTRGNFKVEQLSQSALRQMYAWADVVAVPLKQNSHASGVTVLLEAVVLGKRVVASDTGGLRHYFPDQAGLFCAPANPAALRDRILAVAGASGAAEVGSAQARLLAEDYTTRGYAHRHAVLSRALLDRLGRSTPSPAAS